ncbi:methylenetetrahydrofolate--tRNA-(uracil(54)-C(5))-methyltransferase (FADH(2)-oxidizing) TrmFO [bacterium]|nr:methylenetetrahydrofolate--tRNA-(uracil(54)-C(5))-methyltransferase (FADH(2)-oxidizing) TrmFO [bacterium]
MPEPVIIVGGGLAGSEAALQLAARGVACELWEQRLSGPQRPDGSPWTPAHVSAGLAELVCSNSFKSTEPVRAPGLLKQELRLLGCRLLKLADEAALPGGAALVVDRERFSELVTSAVRSEPLVSLREGEYAELQADCDRGRHIILASGPLSSDALWSQLSALVGGERLYFYDATSPVVAAESVDPEHSFAHSRYDKGEGDDYTNCPLDKEQYLAFREALTSAEVYPIHGGDDYKLFEGCLPIEELAARGRDTMRYGPLKGAGLEDPRTGRWPYSAVQLRWEDAFHSAMSLVGFQTRLRYGEQERVFGMIPALAKAKFIRYGRMHRNCYVEAPRVLQPTLQLNYEPRVMLAGQITGLEGYLSAVATGLWAGQNMARLVLGAEPLVAPEGSCLGSMLRFMSNPAHKKYAPTGFQFGMHTWLPAKMQAQAKMELILQRAEDAWAQMLQTTG